MESNNLDQLKQNYEDAIQAWITSIQLLQKQVTGSTHAAWSEDVWEKANFNQEHAQTEVKEAKKEYEQALRHANFGL